MKVVIAVSLTDKCVRQIDRLAKRFDGNRSAAGDATVERVAVFERIQGGCRRPLGTNRKTFGVANSLEGRTGVFVLLAREPSELHA
jgi:hypothetical protein